MAYWQMKRAGLALFARVGAAAEANFLNIQA